jgi:hypothetical protein
MRDEYLFRASLRVASAILTGVTAALLLEIPLSRSWFSLTSNMFICILTIIAAIRVEWELQAW